MPPTSACRAPTHRRLHLGWRAAAGLCLLIPVLARAEPSTLACTGTTQWQSTTRLSSDGAPQPADAESWSEPFSQVYTLDPSGRALATPAGPLSDVEAAGTTLRWTADPRLPSWPGLREIAHNECALDLAARHLRCAREWTSKTQSDRVLATDSIHGETLAACSAKP